MATSKSQRTEALARLHEILKPGDTVYTVLREPHGRRNGDPDSDGGYALKHRWL